MLPPDAPLTTEWRPDLLGGVTVIRGKFADGKPVVGDSLLRPGKSRRPVRGLDAGQVTSNVRQK